MRFLNSKQPSLSCPIACLLSITLLSKGSICGQQAILVMDDVFLIFPRHFWCNQLPHRNDANTLFLRPLCNNYWGKRARGSVLQHTYEVTLRPPQGVCGARLHKSHKPCAIWSDSLKTQREYDGIASLVQGLWTWWRQASQTPRCGLKYVKINEPLLLTSLF